MPYVQRLAGKIVGVYANSQEGYAEEWLEPDSVDLQPTWIDEKWLQIEAERDRRRLEGGVKVGALWFKTTDRAVGEYATLSLIGSTLPGTTVLRAAWRTMQGTTVDMTPNLVNQILFAGLQNVAAIDDAAQAHKVAMSISVDPSTYDFSAGWPLAFGE